MRYVNQEGVDHILPDGTTVEMKYTQDSLFTTKTQKQKEYVADLQLMNSRGGSEGRTLPETYAQYLLICDNNAIAVAPTEMLEPYLENACCNTNINTLEFFRKQDKTITINNSLVKYYSDIRKKIVKVSSASTLYERRNTKVILPKIKQDFRKYL